MDTNYTIQTSKDNYVTYTTSRNKDDIRMKYIINNCPAITKSTVCIDDKYSNLCQDITDCLMKRIYKLCKDDYTQFGDKELRYDTLEEIIKLLEIEECENE